ncbi:MULTISPECIES: sulfotransferase family protein [Falsihalocynthiibacter]|uniref:sulfotransferase family protein n=1 Tax=Falsihalocynthiibacter TaxID=2854182 RepID=UPI0030017743
MPPNSTFVNDPIVIVGQPRSGSTILTRLLNEDPSVFIVNDFYVLQKIDAENLWEPLTSDEAFRVAQWVYRILEIRSTQEVGKTLEQPIHLSLDNLGEVKQLVCAEWPDFLLWSDVLHMIFERAATLAGATRWGWNTPQDHQHLDRIYAGFPQALVVCQLRQPNAVLASYKNVEGWWHDRRRYNPVVLAYAWKKAAASTEFWLKEKPEQFQFIRYEDLVGDTPKTSEAFARFLRLTALPNSLEGLGENSSMSGTKPKKNVTGLESRLAQKICAESATRLGFPAAAIIGIRMSDFGAALYIVKNSTSLLFSEYLFNNDRRRRLLNLAFKK